MTRLADFMDQNGIAPLRLAKEAGITRQQLLRIRKGIAEPKRPVIRALALAARRLLDRYVSATSLFDLGD
jgi:transcriptional regulator with XRE-family HTH domain